MKTILFTFIFILFMNAFAISQEEYHSEEPKTLFSSGSRVTGWFIDFHNSYSQLNGHYTYLPGFASGVVMNNNFRLGLVGKALSCHEKFLRFDNIFDEPVYLAGGYGGLYMEATPYANKVFHVSVPVIIGGGGAVYLSKERYPEIDEDGEMDYERKDLDSSPFFVIEPGVNVELNVTGFMKLYTGYSYRWINGLNLEHTARSAFNGSNFNLGIKFGKF